MKPTIYFSFFLIVLQVHNGHGDKDPLQEKLASSIADFAFKFSRQVASLQSGKNIFFSPLSISIAFPMISMGTKANTPDQIHGGIRLTSIDTSKVRKGFKQLIRMLKGPGVKMDIGNALWIKNSLQILPKFSKYVKSLYKTENFNFQQPSKAETQVNDYVAKKTHGKITDAVKGLDPATTMILVNYIYFKDDWKYPFDPQLTHKEDFFLDGGKTVKVDMMMAKRNYRYFYDEGLSCWVVEVPYKGGATAWFILPDEGQLKKVEDALGEETMSKWRTSLKKGKEIILSLPKFSMSASYDLKEVLSGLGIPDVFSDNADLSRIIENRKLKATHEAVLEIHEKGSEATSASASGDSPMGITFNRPYTHILSARDAVTAAGSTSASASGDSPMRITFNKQFKLIIVGGPYDRPMLAMGNVMNPVQK